MKLYGIIVFIVLLGLTMSVPIRVETDPELTAGYFEGDMILDIDNRNGIRNELRRWPNKTVHYKFETEFETPQKNEILRAMEILEEASCIRFKPATAETVTYVRITGLDGGCYSVVGYQNNGPQNLNLKISPVGQGCFRVGTIIHEFLHQLGFRHMHSTYNRDDYVIIATQNIQSGKLFNFNKFDVAFINDFGEEYDYRSILHYGAYAFSSNGQRTIIPLQPGVNLGQRVGMSQSDIKKLNAMYKCPAKI